jgi:transposase
MKPCETNHQSAETSLTQTPLPGGGSPVPRLRQPQRLQVEMHCLALDDLLEPAHPARAVWEAVCALNLSAWLKDIQAVEGQPGRDATDPRILVALWVYATLEAVGSARRLARLCCQHVAYRWLCGGVRVNYHLLADFRTQTEKLDGLLTQLVASLMSEGLVSLQRVAQDGMRVRANAGKSSFRRQPRLEQCLAQAEEQVARLKQQTQPVEEVADRRQEAARQRAATERQTRVAAALKQCEELQRQRQARGRKDRQQPARASTTDAEARVMKFADGGFRPGHNVQYATSSGSGIIVGVEVVNAGNDQGQLTPMRQQIQTRYGQVAKEMLVDGGFAALEEIEAAEAAGCQVYAPVRDEAKKRAAGQNPYAPVAGDSAGVASWRARMGTEAARAIYRWRCQTAEWVNALCRNRGLWQMPVRGLKKCKAVALLYALSHNLRQALRLRAAVAMAS